MRVLKLIYRALDKKKQRILKLGLHKSNVLEYH